MGDPHRVTRGWHLYSWVSEVMRVREDFAADTSMRLETSQASSSVMYCWSWLAAVSTFGCWERIVRSSA
jgi:hypothetical protein